MTSFTIFFLLSISSMLFFVQSSILLVVTNLVGTNLKVSSDFVDYSINVGNNLTTNSYVDQVYKIMNFNISDRELAFRKSSAPFEHIAVYLEKDLSLNFKHIDDFLVADIAPRKEFAALPPLSQSVTSSTSTLTFYPTQGMNDGPVYSIASSASGQYAVAGCAFVFSSNDFGITWVAQSSPNDFYSYAAISGSGEYMFASATDLLMSTDYGITWTIFREFTTYYSPVACSESGRQIYILNNLLNVEGHTLYVSNNFGASWSSITTPLSGGAIACSSNGLYLISEGYYSHNNGSTWGDSSITTIAVALNSDGQFGVASGIPLKSKQSLLNIYVSNDYGVNWTVTSLPAASWQSVASSSTGQYLVACAESIYTSGDYGATWEQVGGFTNNTYIAWNAIASNSNGMSILVGGGNEYGIVNTVVYPTSAPTGQPTHQPSSQPSSKPTGHPFRPSGQPSGQPSNRPTRQPSGQPSGQPHGNPTCQPSGQPTTQPSRRPSGQPSDQPSCQPFKRPTSQPSSQPSRQPTRQPSSNPTLFGQTILDKYTLIATSDYTVSHTFTNLGFQFSDLFITATLSDCFVDYSSGGYVNIAIILNGETTTFANVKCAPVDACIPTSIATCLVNYPVKSNQLSSVNGGSFTFVATANLTNAAGSIAVCSISNKVQYFSMAVVVSTHEQPTLQPTRAPTTVAEAAAVSSKLTAHGAPFYVIAGFALLYVALGVIIVRERDQSKLLYKMTLFQACYHMGNLGYYLISEIFYILFLFLSSNKYLHNWGVIVILSRVISTLISVYCLVRMFGPDKFSAKYSALLDQNHILCTKSSMAALILLFLFEQPLLIMFPWKKTTFAELSEGYPDLHMFQVCMFSKWIQSATTLLAQILVVAVVAKTTSRSELALIILYLIPSVLVFLYSTVTIFIQARLGKDDVVQPTPSINPMTSREDLELGGVNSLTITDDIFVTQTAAETEMVDGFRKDLHRALTQQQARISELAQELLAEQRESKLLAKQQIDMKENMEQQMMEASQQLIQQQSEIVQLREQLSRLAELIKSKD